MENASFVSVIHLADTDGNRLVAIYKPMSDKERQALLKRYWRENRWGRRFEAPDVLDVFPLEESCFPNRWFGSMNECEINSQRSY